MNIFKNIDENKSKKKTLGFTIVELLVVIVVIGVLATVTIISYNGIRQRAVAASLQSDLKTSSTRIEMYKTDNDTYPNSVTDCPTPAAGNICLSASGSNVIESYVVDDIEGPVYFLKISNSGLSYTISNKSSVRESIAGFKNVEADSCGLGLDDQLYCWGSLNWLDGYSSGTPMLASNRGVISGKTIKSFSNGGSTCVIASDNLAYCWGWNDNGQLGDNTTTDSLVPVAVYTSGVLSGKTIKQLSIQSVFTCAIASDNLAYCWGYNYHGYLGNNSTVNSSVPVAVDTSGVLSGKTIKYISTGQNSACVIASDDKAYCWGSNSNGELGNNSTTRSLVPVTVDTSGVLSGKTIKSITSGGSHACVIASDDKAYCWGSNYEGKLGNNSTTRSLVPVAVDTSGVLSGKTIVDISAGYDHTCAVASDGKAYCWGASDDGALGDGLNTSQLVPVAANTSGALSGKTLVSIDTDYSTCATDSNGLAYCWGYGENGGLGNTLYETSFVPVSVYLP